MKRLQPHIIILSIGLVLASCQSSLNIERRNNRLLSRNENENQGDQEKRWTKEVFTKKYEQKIYAKYQGQLSIKKTENRVVIDFDTLSTEIDINDSTYVCILTKDQLLQI